ncbi:hypothetical protein [Blastococcus sp. TF02A-30]|uniref:hypothetical protein n=1 Tax=Blastococcus sp. TF02A-30 TaxID=2250580 RepID=UPI0011BD462D|nr:hypothetical protein [Blastococcus sp. TF02A-30]
MPAARTSRPVRLLRALVVAGALAGSTVVLPGVAAADEGVSVTGRLVQAVPDVEQHGALAPETLAWVETAQGAVPVAGGDVEDVPSGSSVRLTVDGPADGATAERPLDVVSTDAVTPPPVQPPLSGPVTNEVTIALVAPAGATPDTDVTAAQVAALVAGPVAQYWSGQTGGAIRVGVGAVHEEWVSTAAACAEARVLWNEVATAVRFQPGPGKHLLLYLSGGAKSDPNCAYALAEIGSGAGTGGRLYVRERLAKPEQLASSIAHELGHNFGLNHSSGLQCDGAVESGACRTAGYRDYYDVMGVTWAQVGSLNPAQAALLGVLPAAREQRLTVADATTAVTLAPASAPAGTRALRLTDAEGTDYWLEYRTATGQDAWLGTAANRYKLETGVLVRRSAGYPDTSLLLDGTPSSAAGWDADFRSALPVGVPVPLSGGDFTVTLRAATAAGAVLDVVPTAPAPGTAAAPAAPRERGTGRVLPSTATADAAAAAAAAAAAPAPQAAPLPMPWYPDVDASALTRSTRLEPVAETTASGGLLVAGAGAALAGATLLLVRRMRAARLR